MVRYSAGDEVRLERTVGELSAGTVCVVREVGRTELTVETRSPISVMENEVTHTETKTMGRTVFRGKTSYRTFSVDPKDVIPYGNCS